MHPGDLQNLHMHLLARNRAIYNSSEPIFFESCLKMLMRCFNHCIASGFMAPSVMPSSRESCFLMSLAGLDVHFSMKSFCLSVQPFEASLTSQSVANCSTNSCM